MAEAMFLRRSFKMNAMPPILDNTEGMHQVVEIITENTVWTPPRGIYENIEVVLIGGGGGGLSNIQGNNFCGGGGGYANIGSVKLTNRNPINIIIGAAGSRGTNNGTSGGTSYFGDYLVANGGESAYINAYITYGGAGGAGGAGMIGGDGKQFGGGASYTEAQSRALEYASEDDYTYYVNRYCTIVPRAGNGGIWGGGGGIGNSYEVGGFGGDGGTYGGGGGCAQVTGESVYQVMDSVDNIFGNKVYANNTYINYYLNNSKAGNGGTYGGGGMFIGLTNDIRYGNGGTYGGHGSQLTMNINMESTYSSSGNYNRYISKLINATNGINTEDSSVTVDSIYENAISENKIELRGNGIGWKASSSSTKLAGGGGGYGGHGGMLNSGYVKYTYNESEYYYSHIQLGGGGGYGGHGADKYDNLLTYGGGGGGYGGNGNCGGGGYGIGAAGGWGGGGYYTKATSAGGAGYSVYGTGAGSNNATSGVCIIRYFSL